MTPQEHELAAACVELAAARERIQRCESALQELGGTTRSERDRLAALGSIRYASARLSDALQRFWDAGGL